MYSSYPPPPSHFPGHHYPPPPPRRTSAAVYVLVAMEKKLLAQGENVLAYYDASVTSDMSEVTFVTPDRVVYAKGTTVASFLLENVARVSQHQPAARIARAAQ